MNHCLNFFPLLIALILSYSIFASDGLDHMLNKVPTGSSNYLALVPPEIMQNHILPHILDPSLVPYFQASVVPECYGNRKMYVYNPWNRKYDWPQVWCFVYHYKILRSIDRCINEMVSLYCAYHYVLGFFILRHIGKGCIEPIKAFLNNGGDINMQFERPSAGIVDTLLSRTVDIAAKAYRHISWDIPQCQYKYVKNSHILDTATINTVRNNHKVYVDCIKIINYLFEKNASINDEIKVYGSALHVAVEASDDVFLLNLLLSKNPSLKKDPWGKTPMDLARQNCRPKSLALLIEYEKEQQALDYKRNVIFQWKSSNRHYCDNREGLI